MTELVVLERRGTHPVTLAGVLLLALGSIIAAALGRNQLNPVLAQLPVLVPLGAALLGARLAFVGSLGLWRWWHGAAPLSSVEEGYFPLAEVRLAPAEPLPGDAVQCQVRFRAERRMRIRGVKWRLRGALEYEGEYDVASLHIGGSETSEELNLLLRRGEEARLSRLLPVPDDATPSGMSLFSPGEIFWRVELELRERPWQVWRATLGILVSRPRF